MALPKIQSDSKFSRIGDKKLKIRAYTGKEEKALLLAKMKNDSSGLVQTAIEVMSAVSDYDASTLTVGEFQRLFIDVRSISVSDTFETSIACRHCEAKMPVKIPASQIKDPEKFVIEKDFSIGKDANGVETFIKLKTPQIQHISQDSGEDGDIKVVYHSIVSVFNSDGDVFEEFTFEEFKPWFESLTGVYLPAVLFVKDSPTVSYKKKFKCAECKKEDEFELKGLESFLA